MEPNSQHVSKNQILFSFTSRHPMKVNRMNYMSEILSVANCFRMAFWPHWTTAGPSLDSANTDGSSDSVNRAHGFSAVPELIPTGSSRIVCNKVTLHYLYTTLCLCGWVPHPGSGSQTAALRQRSLRCGALPQLFPQQMPRKSLRIQQTYNDASHT